MIISVIPKSRPAATHPFVLKISETNSTYVYLFVYGFRTVLASTTVSLLNNLFGYLFNEHKS